MSGSDTPRPPRKHVEANFLVGTGSTQAKNMSFHKNSIARTGMGSVSRIATGWMHVVLDGLVQVHFEDFCTH